MFKLQHEWVCPLQWRLLQFVRHIHYTCNVCSVVFYDIVRVTIGNIRINATPEQTIFFFLSWMNGNHQITYVCCYLWLYPSLLLVFFSRFNGPYWHDKKLHALMKKIYTKTLGKKLNTFKQLSCTYGILVVAQFVKFV